MTEKIRKKILIIDDDPAVIETVSLLLDLEGYTVKSAPSGPEGLKLAQALLPDAIILDINMPGMSGYLVSTMISRDEKLKNIPVLLLTGTAQMAGNVTLNVPGVYRKISKPFDYKVLLKTVSDMLSGK